METFDALICPLHNEYKHLTHSRVSEEDIMNEEKCGITGVEPIKLSLKTKKLQNQCRCSKHSFWNSDWDGCAGVFTMLSNST